MVFNPILNIRPANDRSLSPIFHSKHGNSRLNRPRTRLVVHLPRFLWFLKWPFKKNFWHFKTGLMNLSIVMVFSVSWADAKLVTDRAGIPILLIKVVSRPENTQHWPYLTGSPVSMNCLIILTYQDQKFYHVALSGVLTHNRVQHLILGSITLECNIW